MLKVCSTGERLEEEGARHHFLNEYGVRKSGIGVFVDGDGAFGGVADTSEGASRDNSE